MIGHSSTADTWIGRKVRLREVHRADRQALARFDRIGQRAPDGGYRHWAAHRAAAPADDLELGIETLRGGLLVGSLSTVRTQPGAFSYGIGIGSWHAGCGYAADALTVLLALMFGQRGYRACEISIHGRNFASQTLHSRIGFREIGRLPDPGPARYLVLMSITAAEFATRHPGLTLPLPEEPSRRGRHWRRLRGRHWQS